MSGKRKAKKSLVRSNPKRNKGLTLPGYNYLGPFNDVDDTPPTNKTDAAARKHDIEYSKLGKRAYYTYSKADEDFLNEIKDHKGVGPTIARKVFQAKKRLSTWGVLPTDMRATKGYPLRSNKRMTDYYKKQKPFLDRKKAQILKQTNASNQPVGTSVSNLTSSGTMVDGKGSSITQNANETPVDEVINVTRGPEDYTFTSLPWLSRREVMGEVFHTYKYIYRLTSPYDVINNTVTTDTNTGAGTQNERTQLTTDGVVTKTRWFDYYAGMYNYYHVVSCRYHITLENLATAPLWVHVMYVNDDDIPTKATNDDIRCWKGVKSYYVGPVAHAIASTGAIQDDDDDMGQGNAEQQEQETAKAPTSVNYQSGNHVATRTAINLIKISGTYESGQHRREIHLDADVENWTAVNTNPKLPERLMVIIRPDIDGVQEASGLDNQRPLSYRISQEFEYLTEFKELKAALRYPIVRQPLVVTISENATTPTS